MSNWLPNDDLVTKLNPVRARDFKAVGVGVTPSSMAGTSRGIYTLVLTGNRKAEGLLLAASQLVELGRPSDRRL